LWSDPTRVTAVREHRAGDMIAIRSNINYDRIGGIVVNLSGYIIGDVNSLPDVFSAMKVRKLHTSSSSQLSPTSFLCSGMSRK
jgi:hypothetical protein